MSDSTQTYFEDMWLSLEKELSQYDSFTSSSSFTNNNSSYTPSNSGQSSDFLAQIPPNINTYESLLRSTTPEPTTQQLHSSNLQDRIDAVRDMYNKQTTIIVAKTLNYVNKLSKSGRSDLSNKLAKTFHQFSKIFSYSKEDDTYQKSLSYSRSSSSPKTLSVSVTNKKFKNSINKQFEDLEEAVEFFFQDSYDI